MQIHPVTNHLIIYRDLLMKKLLMSAELVLMLNSPMILAGTEVNIDTNFGQILLELEDERAPKTVENFLRYVREGFYEGTLFHRVVTNFVIQGGGFTPDFTQKETLPPIPNEANNGFKNVRGSVAMARTGDPHSATSQFFINLKDNSFLDHQAPTVQGWGYTVFGKVIKGMEVVDKIGQLPTGSGGPFTRDVPQTPVVINKMSIISTQAKPNTVKGE
jgi:cyclophilin family peptidyl-prolyl cis-trans isomerase